MRRANILPVKDRGKGPAIVLLHGLGNNHKSWTYVLKALNFKKSQVIVPNLLGFGDAPKPKHINYTPQDHATAVIATLDKLQIKNAVIAGHSMGCNVAIEIAKLRPNLAKRLVLLGAPLYRKMPGSSRWDKLTRAGGGYFRIFMFLRDNPDFTIAGAKSADKLLPLLKGMQITKETWPAFHKSLNNTIMQFESYKDLTKLRVPTLLVGGVLDFFIVRKNLRRAARQNRKFITYKTMVGPHEITPLQGKAIARLLQP